MSQLPRIGSSLPHFDVTEDFLRSLRSRPWPRRAVLPDPAFPIALYDCFSHPPLDLHTHEDFSELVIVYQGRGTHISTAAEYPISAGDVFAITGETAHGYKDVDGLCLLNVTYDPRWAFRGMEEVRHLPGYHALFHLEPRYRRRHEFQSRLRLSPEQLEQVLQLFRELGQACVAREPGYRFRVRVLFFQCIAFLCSRYSQTQHPSSRSLILMDKVIQYIESNYQEEVTLRQLCELARMSERNLLMLFKEATGVSPIDYLIRTRLARASELLRREDLSITEVAYRSGFQDSNYFARRFKRATGLRPSEYRARHRPRPRISR